MSEFIKGVLGVLVGFLGTYLTLRLNHRKLHAEIVSKSRNEWINIWRNSLAELIAISDVLKTRKMKPNCLTNNDTCNLNIKYNTLKIMY